MDKQRGKKRQCFCDITFQAGQVVQNVRLPHDYASYCVSPLMNTNEELELSVDFSAGIEKYISSFYVTTS